MSSSRFKPIWVTFFAIFVFAGVESFAEEKEKELPPKGSLSSSTTLGTGSRSLDAPWGDDSVITGGAPISGSVSKFSDREWLMKVFNNSKDSYSVSLKVVQKDSSSRAVKTDHYSYTLKPGKSVERKLPASVGSVGADLELTSWKKIGAAAPQAAKEEAKKNIDPSGQVQPDNYKQSEEGEGAE